MKPRKQILDEQGRVDLVALTDRVMEMLRADARLERIRDQGRRKPSLPKRW